MTLSEYTQLLDYLGREHTTDFIKYHYCLTQEGELKIEKDIRADIPAEIEKIFFGTIAKWQQENSEL